MIVALIDNGSLEPAAHQNLRAVAAALARRAGVEVHAVSWKHGDRIPIHSLTLAATTDLVAASVSEWIGRPWTLAPFVRAQLAQGEREFLFVPFFISAQGAIGSALRGDLEKLARELGGFSFAFSDGLAARGALAEIVAERVRETIAAKNLSRPAVIVVDHGGPSRASATLRDEIAAEVRLLLADELGSLTAASMEGAHGPLFAEMLASARGDVVVAPLFLSPGRHAGPDGDLAQIARAAKARVHFAGLVGTHPRVVAELAFALEKFLPTVSAPTRA